MDRAGYALTIMLITGLVLTVLGFLGAFPTTTTTCPAIGQAACSRSDPYNTLAAPLGMVIASIGAFGLLRRAIVPRLYRDKLDKSR